MRHDYFAASGLSDIATNPNGGNRDGDISQAGNLATLVAPDGGNPGYVDLPGAADPDIASSYIKFPILNNPGDSSSNLATLAQNSPSGSGSLSIEIWMEFENNNLLNPVGLQDESRYNIFQAWSFGGSRVQLYFDQRELGGPGEAQIVGGTKNSDIINAGYRNGDARRQHVVGLHQWVYVFDANFGSPSQDGTWKIYRDGVEMMGDPLEDHNPLDGLPPTGLQANDIYEQVGAEGANIFTLAGSPAEFTLGGEGPLGQDVFGSSPKGKMYRALLYDIALDSNEVMTNFTDGCNGIGPIGVCDPNAVNEDADFDDDNLVDGADFLIWQRGAGGVGTSSTGDANEDALVNNDDLTIWQDQYGGPPIVASSVATVPEPSSALILALGLAGLLPTRLLGSLSRRFPLFSWP